MRVRNYQAVCSTVPRRFYKPERFIIFFFLDRPLSPLRLEDSSLAFQGFSYVAGAEVKAANQDRIHRAGSRELGIQTGEISSV